MAKISEKAWIAPGAVVVGDVTIGDHTSVWYNAVVRADDAKVTIGKNCNIQDNCCIHGNRAWPVELGDNVSIGHGAIVHSARIKDNVLVGMGAILMDDCEIGENSVVAAGTLVTSGKKFPPRSLIMGNPGKVKRELTDEDIRSMIMENVDVYTGLMVKNREGRWEERWEELCAEYRGK